MSSRLLLIGAITALAWVLFQAVFGHIDTSPQWQPVPGEVVQKVIPEAVGKDGVVDAQEFPLMLEKPLFNPKRRPAEKAMVPSESAEAKPEPQSPFPDLELIGLMSSSLSNKRALIRGPKEKYGRWIGVGSEVAGWKLSGITADAAIFRQSDREKRLKFKPWPSSERTEAADQRSFPGDDQ